MDKHAVELRSYELTYLIPGTMIEGDVNQVKTEIEALLKKYKAKDVALEEWGKKAMAYTITHEGKKQTDAYYVHVMFKLDPAKAPELEREVFLQTKIMRHLLLVSDDADASGVQNDGGTPEATT